MKIAIVAVNQRGERIAGKLKKHFIGADIYGKRKSGVGGICPFKAAAGRIFDKKKYGGIIFIAASGIAVRAIAPFIRNKYDDPAVVCVDTTGRYAVSLLSGHEGGANRLAYKVAASIDAEPVITTGTEANKRLIIGIGCRKGVEQKRIIEAIKKVIAEHNIKLREVRVAATIEIKKEEKGLTEACEALGLPLVFITKEMIERFNGDYAGSRAAQRRLGVRGVCEPCALIAGRKTSLSVPKRVIGSVTIAIARED
ncbi:MAG: cobalamin biosynthesis protein [Candidatus Omnitrophota bacterium]|nr:cobalamin biosynthesis protein [Candidatus Omnitrophota bacterium]